MESVLILSRFRKFLSDSNIFFRQEKQEVRSFLDMQPFVRKPPPGATALQPTAIAVGPDNRPPFFSRLRILSGLAAKWWEESSLSAGYRTAVVEKSRRRRLRVSGGLVPGIKSLGERHSAAFVWRVYSERGWRWADNGSVCAHGVGSEAVADGGAYHVGFGGCVAEESHDAFDISFFAFESAHLCHVAACEH